jgi:acyl-CoA oxidase
VRTKLHAVSAGLKATTFNNCLKFAQLNRLCCGGHGYSMSAGLAQVVQEADGGCTYEGDNVVLLLQTARFLLKSAAQKGLSPHLQVATDQSLPPQLAHLHVYIDLFYKLYDE